MYDVKTLESSLKIRSHLLTIKAHTSLSKTFKKINHSKDTDFVLVEKPRSSQMMGVLLARLSGKKFIWIQGFSNPPSPDFFTRLLLSQPDKILVSSKKDITRLKNFGLSKNKIKYVR